MKSWDNVLEMGWQEPSISGSLNLDEELLNLLPKNNWHLDPKSSYFQKYQEVIFIGITISGREIELFDKILEEIEPLREELTKVCND